MFDHIGDVDPRSIDSRLGEAAVEQLSRRSDKWVASQVLRITGLLADQHDERTRGTLAKYGLGGSPVQRAIGATRCGLAQSGNRRRVHDHIR
jgi:hypothetical protein